MPQPHELTELLLAWGNGDQAARDKLVDVVYDELRRLAEHHMRRERPGHTLQATALVNEVYLRLFDRSVAWQNRAHFFGIAARVMRQVLVEYARTRNYLKRGGREQKVSLSEAADLGELRAQELVALDDSLNGLEAIDPQKVRIVELRFFAGLTIQETAECLKISHATVEREWKAARAWLLRELTRA